MIVGTGVLGLGGNDMLLEVVVGVSSCIGSSVVDDVASLEKVERESCGKILMAFNVFEGVVVAVVEVAVAKVVVLAAVVAAAVVDAVVDVAIVVVTVVEKATVVAVVTSALETVASVSCNLGFLDWVSALLFLFGNLLLGGLPPYMLVNSSQISSS